MYEKLFYPIQPKSWPKDGARSIFKTNSLDAFAPEITQSPDPTRGWSSTGRDGDEGVEAR